MTGNAPRQGPRKPLPRTYTTLGCSMGRGRSLWCHRMCKPIAGRGVCGRLAPHAMLDRYQLAILAHRELASG